MATYTKQDIENLKTRIRAELPALVQANPGESTGQLETLYCDANPVLVDQFGMTKSKHNWSVVQVKVYDCIQELKKSGELITHKRGYYHPDFDLTTIPAKAKAKAKAKKAKAKKVEPVVETVVEPTLEVEETQEVEETHVPVEVDNPAVIEAHIDTTTNELVENVGGSKDYRISLDKVEDGYITSSVQVSTTTLEPVEVEETVEPNLIEETQEPNLIEETQEEVEVKETPVAEQVDNEPVVVHKYDLKALRQSASFDPIAITIRKVTGEYEVYRDMENRNIVLTQVDRKDYEVISVDVDHDHLKSVNPVLSTYASQAISDFEKASNHKEGCTKVVRALVSCLIKCQHTDDFGGFVEECVNPVCPLKTIWGGGATNVNPNAS